MTCERLQGRCRHRSAGTRRCSACPLFFAHAAARLASGVPVITMFAVLFGQGHDTSAFFTGRSGALNSRWQRLIPCGRARLAQSIRPDSISLDDSHRFEEAGYDVRSAVYGTVPLESTPDIFDKVRDITKLRDLRRFLENETFVDLGSGEGELVVNALRQHPVLGRSVGIELCRDRHKVAEERAAALPPDLRARTCFIEGDICDEASQQIREAISSARVVFINSVMFDAGLVERLSSLLHRLVAARGRAAVVVSFGKQLDLQDRPSAVHSGLLRGSWGLAPVYTYGLLPNSQQ